MARCSGDGCRRWRPDLLVNRGRAGACLDGYWYCSEACLQTATRQQLDEPRPPREWPSTGPRLGALLVHQRALTAAALRAALRDQIRTRLPLGQQLQAMGLVSADDVLRALSTQAGVSYLAAVNPSKIRLADSPVSATTLSQLGLVPVHVDPGAQRMRLACVAPVPWAAIHVLADLSGWKAEPLLVGDVEWQGLTSALEAQDEQPVIPVNDVDDAAARAARLVRERHALDASVVRLDPYILVWLESRDRYEDQLFHIGQVPEEASCQAASTSR